MKKNKNQKKKYEHLSQFDRDRIEALLKAGHQQKEIAVVLKKDKSTISREIKRNRRKKIKNKKIRDGPYEAGTAQHKAYVRRHYAKYQGQKINEDDNLKNYIVERLKRFWSPDEISGKTKKEGQSFYASKTAIYQWLYSAHGQRYCPLLYSQRYYPRKRKEKKFKKVLIPNRKSIIMRPQGANRRTRYGHYESDTVVSGKKTGSRVALTVIYERKAKYIDIQKIQRLKPALNNRAIKQMTQKLNKTKSITFDNGIENVHHEQLGVATYFCDPYSSWQKGGIENSNKSIRRFIPKGSDLKNYSNNYIKMIVDILNNKPRKSLKYQSPQEVMIKNNLLKVG